MASRGRESFAAKHVCRNEDTQQFLRLPLEYTQVPPPSTQTKRGANGAYPNAEKEVQYTSLLLFKLAGNNPKPPLSLYWLWPLSAEPTNSENRSDHLPLIQPFQHLQSRSASQKLECCNLGCRGLSCGVHRRLMAIAPLLDMFEVCLGSTSTQGCLQQVHPTKWVCLFFENPLLGGLKGNQKDGVPQNETPPMGAQE